MHDVGSGESERDGTLVAVCVNRGAGHSHQGSGSARTPVLITVYEQKKSF